MAMRTHGPVVTSYTALDKIDSLLARFGAIVWISVLAGTVIPAMVAAEHHVFYETVRVAAPLRVNITPLAQRQKGRAGVESPSAGCRARRTSPTNVQCLSHGLVQNL